MPVTVSGDLLKEEDGHDDEYDERDDYGRGVYGLYDEREDLDYTACSLDVVIVGIAITEANAWLIVFFFH
jgi:hypothetical protein